MWVSRRLRYSALAVSSGAGNWFGAAGYTRGGHKGGYRKADIAYPHHYGAGRHAFLDVAVADPCGGAALSAAPPSSEASGVAAALRADKKNAKYKPLAAAVSSEFYAAVVERYGACGGSLIGWFKHLCGDREREALECDDYSLSQSSHE